MKSIDRLREYVTGPARCGISHICEKNILKNLDSIEQEVKEMQRALTIDMQPMTDENMAEHGWVRLPVDAEGEVIHIGELVDEKLPFGGYAPPAPIDTMELSRGASGYRWMVKLDAENRALVSPKLLRHHHAPTVEDVLREFAAKLCIRDGFPTATEETFAEYAAKLTLRGDE